MRQRAEISPVLIFAAALPMAACSDSGAQPRRQESFEELYKRQEADFAASPDVQLPEVRKRLAALGVQKSEITQAKDDDDEAILLLSPSDATFEAIDKRMLAKLQLDSRFRFQLTKPAQAAEFARYSVAEMRARDKAKALSELAEKGETNRIPRYRTGMPMNAYARALEHYCGYGDGEALRVIDGEWLDYTHKMASDGAIAASKGQSWAPFACIKRVVDATDLGRHFIGNRGREGTID